MKQILLFTCLLFAMYTRAQVKLENIVKPGTKLIYSVRVPDTTYNFIVTVNDLKGTSFKWEMTDPVNISGSITQTAAAIDSADRMYNFFQPGDKKLDDQTLSVWLSQKCFDQFERKTGKPIQMYLGGPGAEPQDVGTFAGDMPLAIIIDGKPATVREKMVKTLINSGQGYVPSEENEGFFTYYGSASFPIILRMNLSFSITLKEIRTK